MPTLIELRRNALGDVSARPPKPQQKTILVGHISPSRCGTGGARAEAARVPDGGHELFNGQLSLTRRMHKSGVLFLAGTDSPNPYILPGFALHDELKLLVSAGFSPMEALQAATLNPARYLGKEKDLGTIETGKFADLVLLDANPLDDISNTRKIRAVIVNGRYLSRESSNAMLAGVQAAAK